MLSKPPARTSACTSCPSRARSAASRISPREREVLHFLAQDKTNAQIAAALFISENTVKSHVANILEKYSARNRHAAVMAAIRDGLLTVD